MSNMPVSLGGLEESNSVFTTSLSCSRFEPKLEMGERAVKDSETKQTAVSITQGAQSPACVSVTDRPDSNTLCERAAQGPSDLACDAPG